MTDPGTTYTIPNMTRSTALLLLLLAAPSLSAFPLAAQTTTHRSTTAQNTQSTAALPAVNPPGVPPVTGTPEILYALRYVDVTLGDGPLALPQKYYTVKYTGWLTDGTKFDSSYDHPGAETFTFPYGARRVIPGWDTGFEGMHVGGKRRLYVPYQLAYGEAGREGIPPKADLIFDVELVSFSDTPSEPPAPPTPPQPAQNPAQPAQNPGATPPENAPTTPPPSNPPSSNPN